MNIEKNFSKFLNRKINYVDIGAAGGLPKILYDFRKSLYTIGFAPFLNSYNKLISNQESYFFNIGLSNSKGERTLYVTENPFQSSFYPPSNKLKKFDNEHYKTRKITSKIKVKVNRLDNVFKEIKSLELDIVKIDTQGSELDILKGAIKTLQKFYPVLLIETWTVDVYENAPKLNEILNFLEKINYEIWDLEKAAAWHHADSSPSSKPILIGLNLLCGPKNIKNRKIWSVSQASIIALFVWNSGYIGKAYEICSTYKLTELKNILLKLQYRKDLMSSPLRFLFKVITAVRKSKVYLT